VTFGGNLRCTCADEVILLLKSSDAVAHDLQHAYSQCEDCAPQEAPHTPLQLVLKKWCAFVHLFYKWHARGRSHASPAIRFELKPAGEFRCFVRNGRLVGISQRHVADHFPYLADDVPQLQRKMLSFHRDNVQNVFPQPHCECAFARDCVN